METLETSKKVKSRDLLAKIFGMKEIGALLPLILVLVITSIINPSFYSGENILNMLRATSYMFIPAVAMTFVLCSRNLDLSVGSQLALYGVVQGAMMVYLGLPMWAGIVLTLIGGALAGALNGMLVVVIGIPPFIATLATYYLYLGLVYGITKGQPISGLPPNYEVIGQGTFLSIPYSVYIMALIGIVGAFVLAKTRYGRYVLATGGNEENARLAGINVKMIVFSTYVFTGLLVAVSSILFASRFASIQINVGRGFELRVIAACIIGGVSLFGGSGTILGSLFGSLFMIALDNALVMARVSGYWQMAVLGVIIVLAIMIDLARKGELFAKLRS